MMQDSSSYHVIPIGDGPNDGSSSSRRPNERPLVSFCGLVAMIIGLSTFIVVGVPAMSPANHHHHHASTTTQSHHHSHHTESKSQQTKKKKNDKGQTLRGKNSGETTHEGVKVVPLPPSPEFDDHKETPHLSQDEESSEDEQEDLEEESEDSSSSSSDSSDDSSSDSSDDSSSSSSDSEDDAIHLAAGESFDVVPPSVPLQTTSDLTTTESNVKPIPAPDHAVFDHKTPLDVGGEEKTEDGEDGRTEEDDENEADPLLEAPADVPSHSDDEKKLTADDGSKDESGSSLDMDDKEEAENSADSSQDSDSSSNDEEEDLESSGSAVELSKSEPKDDVDLPVGGKLVDEPTMEEELEELEVLEGVEVDEDSIKQQDESGR